MPGKIGFGFVERFIEPIGSGPIASCKEVSVISIDGWIFTALSSDVINGWRHWRSRI